jgi:hypothetical protein
MMIIVIMIMSIRYDYVSELRPPISMFFIHQVIYKHVESWWNDIDRGNS